MSPRHDFVDVEDGMHRHRHRIRRLATRNCRGTVVGCEGLPLGEVSGRAESDAMKSALPIWIPHPERAFCLASLATCATCTYDDLVRNSTVGLPKVVVLVSLNFVKRSLILAQDGHRRVLIRLRN